MELSADKRIICYAFIGCLIALIVWAAATQGYQALENAWDDRGAKQRAIARCIQQNSSPRDYQSHIQEYCEAVWNSYLQ